MGDGGRVVIPAEVRQALGLKSGSQVLLSVEDGELRILTTRQAIRRAQKLAEPYIQPGVSVVDELIAERRAEDARDEEVAQTLGAGRE
jgi:AbrB family looped-hinge helix DNA binding protein